MAGISVSGLISNSFDWKSVVDQLIQIDSAPIARMQSEESLNIDKLAVLATLDTKVTDLQSAAQALSADSLFKSRTASSATPDSSWTASAADLATTGNYKIAVTQLATAARLNGTASISTSISPTDDVSGLTLANIATASAITVSGADNTGSFSVNGKRVTIALTDSLQDVFTKISTATGGAVTASYSTATDTVQLTSADPIVLGAANDSTNFLSVMRLSSGNSPVTSSAALGSTKLNTPLTSARIAGDFGVDGSGVGRFEVNGVGIDYNINTDSLSAILSRINDSGAGVTATYDLAGDRVVLTNNSTGDIGIGVQDTTGTLMGALGLAGVTTTRGQNALFTVNDSPTQLSSLSNTLDATAHGITGLSVTVNSETTQTINVAPNTAAMKTAIQDFVTKFNAVQSYIDSQTKINTTADGKVSAAVMAGDHEMQSWGSELRAIASKTVSGLSTVFSRLENIGVDFTPFQPGMSAKTWSSSADLLVIKDPAKLDTALAKNTADVAALFNTPTTGLMAQFKSYLSARFSTTSGALKGQKDTLNKQNAVLDAQIIALTRRLENQRQVLTTAFLAMQTAQSRAQQQQQSISGFIKQSQSSSN
jgi:flagellar hook-associated protein 2